MILIRNFEHSELIWALFAATSLATIMAKQTLWATAWYRGYLIALGIVCLILAATILMRTGIKLWPVAGVVIGLFIGQWWIIQTLLLALAWRNTGFAP